MYVLLDTNILFKDYFFESRSIKTLFSYLDTCGHNLLLPKIVVDELVVLYREELEETNENIKKARRNINLLRINKKPNYIDVHLEVGIYKKHLIKILKQRKVVILDNDDTHYKKIINRSLQKIPPFSPKTKKGDSGFKDAIIWESFKEACFLGKYQPLCFITKNKIDFSDPGDEAALHPVLEKELLDTKFFYFQNLESFLEKYGVLLKDVNQRVILDAVSAGFRAKVRLLSEIELREIFSGGSAYPIHSIESDSLEFELRHHYVIKADRKNYYVVATGNINAVATFYNPIDNGYFSGSLTTAFETTIKIEKQSKKIEVETFEIETISLF